MAGEKVNSITLGKGDDKVTCTFENGLPNAEQFLAIRNRVCPDMTLIKREGKPTPLAAVCCIKPVKYVFQFFKVKFFGQEYDTFDSLMGSYFG